MQTPSFQLVSRNSVIRKQPFLRRFTVVIVLGVSPVFVCSCLMVGCGKVDAYQETGIREQSTEGGSGIKAQTVFELFKIDADDSPLIARNVDNSKSFEYLVNFRKIYSEAKPAEDRLNRTLTSSGGGGGRRPSGRGSRRPIRPDSGKTSSYFQQKLRSTLPDMQKACQEVAEQLEKLDRSGVHPRVVEHVALDIKAFAAMANDYQKAVDYLNNPSSQFNDENMRRLIKFADRQYNTGFAGTRGIETVVYMALARSNSKLGKDPTLVSQLDKRHVADQASFSFLESFIKLMEGNGQLHDRTQKLMSQSHELLQSRNSGDAWESVSKLKECVEILDGMAEQIFSTNWNMRGVHPFARKIAAQHTDCLLKKTASLRELIESREAFLNTRSRRELARHNKIDVATAKIQQTEKVWGVTIANCKELLRTGLVFAPEEKIFSAYQAIHNMRFDR